MPYITVGKENSGNIDLFYKDWGKGQPIVFSHGWPLSADDWDTQMLFFLRHGYRVIAHDRRGHGRSTQRPSSTGPWPSGPFYGFNRPGVESSEAIIENWWRQGMMGGAKAHYDGIVAFSQTDF